MCAAALAVALAILVTVPKLHGAPASENTEGAAQGHAKRHWAPTFSPAEPYAPYHNADCQSPKDREEADLCQQWRVAEATEKAVAFAEPQFWISVFQAFTALLAAGATILAAWSARDAAQAARESAIVAARALNELERAFVCLGGLTVEHRPKEGVLKVSAKWENSGNTPTKHCIGYINCANITADMREFGFPDLPGNPPVKFVIGPQQKISTASLKLLEPRMANAIRGVGAIYAWGWVEYDDLMPGTIRHRTEFCFRVHVRESDDTYKPTTTVHSAHNGMDDECPADRYRTIKGGAPNPAFKKPA